MKPDEPDKHPATVQNAGVYGYTGLMSKDEDETIECFIAFRDAILRLIPSNERPSHTSLHSGRSGEARVRGGFDFLPSLACS
jgi:hypothetical protein